MIGKMKIDDGGEDDGKEDDERHLHIGHVFSALCSSAVYIQHLVV